MAFVQKIYDLSVAPYLKDVPLIYSAEGCIVAMFFLVYASKLVHVLVSVLLTAKYDNVQSSHRYSGKNDGTWTWQRLATQRAFNAHQNQWEAFLAFGLSMLLALHQHVDRTALTQLGNAFLCVRVLYNVVYVLAFNLPLSVVRSAVWGVGFSILLKILSLAVPSIQI
ncbi:MAPEG family protein [archaeon]|nr:MAG: MAPEG family protein [archaeon]